MAAQCETGVDAWLCALNGGEPWVPGVRMIGWHEAAAKLATYDLAHIHGIWSLGLHRVALACRRAGVKYVLAPRGMLEPWSLRQKWLKKRLARWLYQDRDLKGAAALHATAESEAAQFRRLGFRNAVFVSPNGVNLPAAALSRSVADGSRKRALFMSRMHPKKGVMELVEAWGSAADWECELVYTVHSDFEREYEEKVRSRVAELGLEDRFFFTGALDDERKWEAYARADLFVLPTYSENFGIVVAEALWAGLPVITTKGTPWHDLETAACGWWTDVGVAACAEALNRARSLSREDLLAMGARGHDLVAEKYTWGAAIKPMLKSYGEIVK